MNATFSGTALGVALALLATSCAAQEASPAAGAGDAQLQPGATLVGTVGTAQDPESFEIALTTRDGQDVEVVAAGTYTLVVDDFAQIHNFHLMGDGVDAATEVAGTGRMSFEVTFQSGQYRYVCDPHPSMRGDLRVI